VVLQSLPDVSVSGVKLEKLFKKSKNQKLGRLLIDEIPRFVAKERFLFFVISTMESYV